MKAADRACLSPMLMPVDCATTRGAAGTGFLDRRTADRTGFVLQRTINAFGAKPLPFGISDKFLFAVCANTDGRARDIPAGPTRCRAFSTAKHLPRGFVGCKFHTTNRACPVDLPCQAGLEISTAKFIAQKIRHELRAQIPRQRDAWGGNAQKRVLRGLAHNGRHSVISLQASRKPLVVSKRELLGGDLNPPAIPRAIVANQARQRDRMRHHACDTLWDNLWVAIELQRDVREAGRGNSMKPCAAPGFTVSPIEVCAILNRARPGLQPLPFCHKPLNLFFGVIAGEVIIHRCSRERGGHIAKKRADANLFLEFREMDIFMHNGLL
jgi:hypothetical protein